MACTATTLHLLVIIAICWTIPAAAQDGFRDATWGMSPDEVEEAIGCDLGHTKPKYKFGDKKHRADFESCEDEVLGKPVDLVFRFDDDELTAASVRFQKQPGRWALKCKQTYDEVLGVMTDKYGDPVDSVGMDGAMKLARFVEAMWGDNDPIEEMGKSVEEREGANLLKTHVWVQEGITMIHNENGVRSSLAVFYESEKAEQGQKATEEL